MTKLKAVPASGTAPHRAALEQVRSSLKSAFLERDEIIDGLLAALLCRQHVLLLGPPGTAKSALVTTLTGCIGGTRCFSWLLTKFSTPEEIFGPVSLKALQQDRVARILNGKLPEAHVGFLDEIFKANSAILNALLTLANERAFHNDGRTIACPLITLVGASNELPEGAELEALFDRFLLRFWTPYLRDNRNMKLLLEENVTVRPATLSLGDLRDCQKDVSLVSLADPVVDAVIAIKTKTEEQGFRSSDRRWKQIIGLLKARAYLEGADAVSEDHLDVLADALWRDPKDRAALAGIIGSVGNPLNVRAMEILDAAKEALAKLGNPNAEDAAAKADWLRAASLVESRLVDMDKELHDLVQQNPRRNLRRVREAGRTVERMKLDVTRRVAQLYNL